MKDILRYDKMVEAALRGVVREVLARAAASGLPGAHHFYITFRTGFPGVAIPDFLVAQYPGDMTVVLEHQFWDLEVEEEKFSVSLNFKGQPERLSIPFEAITAFADPSVKFGLQFQVAPAAGDVPAAEPAPARSAPAAKSAAKSGAKTAAKPADKSSGGDGQVVALDKFRKKK